MKLFLITFFALGMITNTSFASPSNVKIDVATVLVDTAIANTVNLRLSASGNTSEECLKAVKFSIDGANQSELSIGKELPISLSSGEKTTVCGIANGDDSNACSYDWEIVDSNGRAHTLFHASENPDASWLDQWGTYHNQWRCFSLSGK